MIRNIVPGKDTDTPETTKEDTGATAPETAPDAKAQDIQTGTAEQALKTGETVEEPDFKDFVPVGEEMTPAEALGWMYKYYPETTEGVFEREFPHLAKTKGPVHFRQSHLQRHGGAIILECVEKEEPWYYLLSSRSGLKQAKIG